MKINIGGLIAEVLSRFVEKKAGKIPGEILRQILKEDAPAESESDAPEVQVEMDGDAPAEQRQELPRVLRVKATTFLNQSDDRNGATAQQPAYPWAPRYFDGCGKVLFGAAVPMKVNQGDKLRIRRVSSSTEDPGTWYLSPIIDKGPHNVNDNFLITGARPQAETEEGNGAGVDCTPPLMAKLLGVTTEAAYTGELSCWAEVQLVRAKLEYAWSLGAKAATDAVKAARALPRPFPYARETNAGELGCAQVISTALVNAGLLERVTLAVVELRRALEKAGWRTVPKGDPLQPGDVVVWGPTKGGTHKHVGMIVEGSPGPVVLHNSSADRRVVERPLTTITRPVEVILRR